jgi:hypothetical protein
MKLQVKASYQNESKIGLIRISKMVNNKPIEYSLQLFESRSINIKKSKFPSISLAITHASLYGFLTNLWSIEEVEY